MPDLYHVIGGRIRDARRTRDLSQSDLASKLNLSRSSITNIENGTQRISVLDLYKIAAAFDLDVVELLPGRIELAKSPNLPFDKIDNDPRFTSNEKKELRKVVHLLQGD